MNGAEEMRGAGEMVKQRNVELLKAMDTVVRLLNDEDAEECWLQEGVPDGAGYDDLQAIAVDPEQMEWCRSAFRRVMHASMRHGWHTGGPLYGAAKKGE